MNDVEILLVEDNASDAELTIRALKKNNLANKIEHVSDGPEALDFLFCRGKYASRNSRNKPRVILLDIKLPKLNGLEVLKEIKSMENSRSIPVVMLTSSKEDPDIEKAYSYGANSYIVKPVEFENFIKALTNIGYYWMLVNHPPKE